MAKTEAETKASESRTATEVADSYFAAVALNAMEAHWDPQGTGRIYGIAELRQGDNYREWFGAFFASFPDLEFEVLTVTGDDNRAAVHWRARGTFDGTTPFEGLDPNGKKLDVQGIDLLTVRDGIIVDLDALTNSVVMLRQLGALPESGSGPEKAMLGALNLRTKVAKRFGRA